MKCKILKKNLLSNNVSSMHIWIMFKYNSIKWIVVETVNFKKWVCGSEKNKVGSSKNVDKTWSIVLF